MQLPKHLRGAILACRPRAPITLPPVNLSGLDKLAKLLDERLKKRGVKK